jgi:hypothetical protein
MKASAFRLALVWLMAMALPLQAVATTAMLLCASAPAHQVQSAHDHGASAATRGAKAQGAIGHPTRAHHAGAQPAADLNADAQHQCSACASCCAGAAFAIAAIRVPADDPEREAAAPLLLHEPSVVLSGLERPPRSRG